MSTIRERPKGLTPAPLKPRLAAHISTPKSTPPPRLTVRSQESPASPASVVPPRRPLIATNTANARQSPATPTTSTAAKVANTSTPTNRPLLRAAQPSSAHSSLTLASTNSRSTTPVTTPRTSNTSNRTLREAPSNRTLREAPSNRTLREAPSNSTLRTVPSNRTLRKAPSSYFSPTETRSRPVSPVRPPLIQKASSFVYANGESGEEIIKNQRASDVQSVRSQQMERSSGRTFVNGVQTENLQASARSSVASPLVSPLATPSLAQPAVQVLTPVPIQANASGAKSIAARLDDLTPPDSRPITPAVQATTTSQDQVSKPSTPLNNLDRIISPTESEGSTGVLDSNFRVVRTKISVDFPSKLPSPARRRSVVVERKASINSTFSPGHRKIQSVSAATPPPPRLSRIDTGITASPISEGIISSPVPSRLPRLSIDAGISAQTTADVVAVEGDDKKTPGPNESEAPPAHAKIGAARHERKLLDLEISNSSLLAINRSLEREVLKQKSELRRLRRATRGSLANDRTSWLSAMSVGEDALSDMGMSSPADSEIVDQSTVDDIDTPTKVYGQPSHSSTDTRTNLDLSKHKDLLIDSQKMNLSLQRCLGMTEQLLKDANKALNYQPQVTSKVVSPEQSSLREEQSIRDDYFTKDWDWTNASDGHELNPRRSSDGRETTTDKDSGIELDDVAHCRHSKDATPHTTEVDGELA